MNETYREIGNLDKAAVLLLTLSDDNAAKILNKLSESEIQKISAKIANLKEIGADKVLEILSHFINIMNDGALVGGHLPKLKRFLSKVFDDEKVDAIIKNIDGALDNTWTSIAHINNEVLVEYLKNEYPQTIAFILSKLPSEKVANIIEMFSENFAFDIIKRMLKIDTVNKQTIFSIENSLKKELVENATTTKDINNHEVVASVFNNFNKKNETLFLSLLEKYDPQKAYLVRKHMLLFEDIKRIDSRGMQLLIRYADKSALPKALKFADESIKEYFFSNMSVRAAKIVTEEIEGIKSLKKEEGELAQKQIINVLRTLINKGQVSLSETRETYAKYGTL